MHSTLHSRALLYYSIGFTARTHVTIGAGWPWDLPIPVTSERRALSLTARCFLACLGSPTTQSSVCLALSTYLMLPSAVYTTSALWRCEISRLNTQPTSFPCQRFPTLLTNSRT